jgi:hypothetical protein
LEAATFSWGQPSLPEKKGQNWQNWAELDLFEKHLWLVVGNTHPIHHICPYIGKNHPNIWKNVPNHQADIFQHQIHQIGTVLRRKCC